MQGYKINLHEAYVETPRGVIPLTQFFLESQGDNKTFIGGMAQYIVIADKPEVDEKTKGVLYGIAISVRPNVDRINIPFDDAAGIVVQNDGQGIGTDAFYCGNGPFLEQDWRNIFQNDANSENFLRTTGKHDQLLDGMEAKVSGRAIAVKQDSGTTRDNQPVYVVQAGKGDARIGFEIAKVIGWEAGIDQSDRLCFNISNSSGKGDFTDVGIRIFPDGGLVVGNPKGGSKGKGTINVEKVYVDGELQQ